MLRRPFLQLIIILRGTATRRTRDMPIHLFHSEGLGWATESTELQKTPTQEKDSAPGGRQRTKNRKNDVIGLPRSCMGSHSRVRVSSVCSSGSDGEPREGIASSRLPFFHSLRLHLSSTSTAAASFRADSLFFETPFPSLSLRFPCR